MPAETSEHLPATHDTVCLGITIGKPMLQLRFGHASGSAGGKSNEDFYGVVTPREEPETVSRGVAVAIADGVSGNGGGRMASETTVKSLLRDFYGTPVGWNIPQSIDRVLCAINDWLLAENVRRPELEGMVSTLTMLLFKGNQYCMAHVGDTRVYRRRGDVFKQLTIDHTWPRSDMRHVLKRAVGLDTHLIADYTDGELLPGDVFVLVTDGVWEVLGDRVMHEVLQSRADAQSVASALVAQALESQARYMGRNDATAVVVAVEEIRSRD